MPDLCVTFNDQSSDFDNAQVVTIGRHSESLIRVPDSLVSRRHGEVRFDGSHWIFHDLDSRNGSFVDRVRVTQVTINAVTNIRLGDEDSGPLIRLEPLAATVHKDSSDPADTIDPLPNPDEKDFEPDPLRALGEASFIHRPDLSLARIGRASDNDIVIDDLLVSRHHAELRKDGEDYVLVDLNSQNGTFINGKRIDRSVLTSRDYVTIGHHLFRVVHGTLEEYVDTGEITFEALGVTVQTDQGRTLVDNISFSLERSSLVAVVGPSGAGKSTLLNALAGFRPADEGTVLYNERDLYDSYEDLRQRIGYVPQDDVLHPQLTVRRALQFAAQLRFPSDVRPEERSRRVDEVMAELGLSERADLAIQQLSGGQRKRASIALELLTKPSLLFLDEPTSGLDPGYEKAIMSLLRDLANGGRTVLVVTHSVQSLDVCDRVMFLAPGGRMAYFGPPCKALVYFDVSDYADIFTSLDRDRQTDWRERFRDHPFYDGYVRQPLLGHESKRGSAGSRLTLPPDPQQVWWHQFKTLTLRYLSVMASDRRSLLTLLLQAPLLGLLIYAIAPSGSFDTSPGSDHHHATMVALMIVLAVTFMGSANAIREIVKELPIYRRERAVGLSISAYIASKVSVLSALTIIQSVVLVVLATQRQDGPTSSATGLFPGWELAFDVVVAGVSAMAIALLISAAVSASDKAMALLPLLLIPQIILSGGLISLQHNMLMHAISDVVTANWGLSAVASTVNLNFLNGISPLSVGINAQWAQTGGMWFRNIAALLILTGTASVGTWILLRHRDPFAVGTSPLAESIADALKHTGLQGEAANLTRDVLYRGVQGLIWIAIFVVLHQLR